MGNARSVTHGTVVIPNGSFLEEHQAEAENSDSPQGEKTCLLFTEPQNQYAELTPG